MINKIISGGQTGADRAALDFALTNGISCGGFCPKGRAAEDGPIDEKYPLAETQTDDPAQRTAQNVLHADGTLIICQRVPFGGTALAVEVAFEAFKPFFVQNMKRGYNIDDIKSWMLQYKIKTLNIAGPRESEEPGSYELTMKVLGDLIGSDKA